MRFKEDSIFLLLPTNAAICENFLLPKYIRPKISALTVRPRNQKSEFSPLFSLLSAMIMMNKKVDYQNFTVNLLIAFSSLNQSNKWISCCGNLNNLQYLTLILLGLYFIKPWVEDIIKALILRSWKLSPRTIN